MGQALLLARNGFLSASDAILNSRRMSTNRKCVSPDHGNRREEERSGNDNLGAVLMTELKAYRSESLRMTREAREPDKSE